MARNNMMRLAGLYESTGSAEVGYAHLNLMESIRIQHKKLNTEALVADLPQFNEAAYLTYINHCLVEQLVCEEEEELEEGKKVAAKTKSGSTPQGDAARKRAQAKKAEAERAALAQTAMATNTPVPHVAVDTTARDSAANFSGATNRNYLPAKSRTVPVDPIPMATKDFAGGTNKNFHVAPKAFDPIPMRTADFAGGTDKRFSPAPQSSAPTKSAVVADKRIVSPQTSTPDTKGLQRGPDQFPIRKINVGNYSLDARKGTVPALQALRSMGSKAAGFLRNAYDQHFGAAAHAKSVAKQAPSPEVRNAAMSVAADHASTGGALRRAWDGIKASAVGAGKAFVGAAKKAAPIAGTALGTAALGAVAANSLPALPAVAAMGGAIGGTILAAHGAKAGAKLASKGAHAVAQKAIDVVDKKRADDWERPEIPMKRGIIGAALDTIRGGNTPLKPWDQHTHQPDDPSGVQPGLKRNLGTRMRR